MGHTPGPWHVGTPFGRKGVHIPICPDKPTLALLEIAQVRTHMDNARLIAASPRLLDALEGALAYCGEHTGVCATQPTWASGLDQEGPCDCWYDAAETAIAAAKGETQ